MAATNINRVVLTGNLTRDPELRSLPSGTSVCSLRIASNTRRKDSTASGSTSPTTSASPSGAPRARTAPASCPRAARSASTAASSGASGRRQDGAKRESVEIVADSVQFLGGRDDGGADGRRRPQQRLRAALGRPGGHVGLRAAARRRAQQRAGGRRHPVLGRASEALRAAGGRPCRGDGRGPVQVGRSSRRWRAA